MKPDKVAERFAHDVRNHAMVAREANGVHRYLRFRAPNSTNYWFELVTWPGHLCITGDCGSFVFSRLHDMFEFFRDDEGRVNPSYWSEKVMAQDRSSGVKEWSREAFKEYVLDRFKQFCDGNEVSTSLRKVWKRQLESHVLGDCDEWEAWDRLRNCTDDIKVGRHRCFADIEDDCKVYTFRFLWCLHAIVWGIKQFDALP